MGGQEPGAGTARLRRIDHVGVVVRDIDGALGSWTSGLGLTVVHDETVGEIATRLTYLTGDEPDDALLQLVQPLDEHAPVSGFLAEVGEGLHHVCFAVDHIPAALAAIGNEDTPLFVGGRRRRCCFIAERPTMFELS